MREVVTLEWDNCRGNKLGERDKGENHKKSQERAKGEYQKRGAVQFNLVRSQLLNVA